MARIGEQWQWFDGKVVDVKDPHESGRVRVRIKGYHDDESKIPNNKLPWAQVLMPVSSAGVNKVGASPTGLLPGSNVIGFFYDVDRVEMPFIIGSFIKAGDLNPGGTSTGGTESLKKGTNSGSPLFRNNTDRTPLPLQNALDPNTKRNDDEELPNKSITEVAAEGLAFAAQKTIGALAGGLQSEVLNTISRIDPSNISGSIPSALNSMMRIDAISMVMNASGLFNMASSALQSIAAQVINDLGGNSAAVNNVIGTFVTFMNSPEFSKMSSNDQLLFAEMVYKLMQNTTTPSITPVPLSVVPTLDNPSELINSVASQAINVVSNTFTNMLLNRSINAASMGSVIGLLNSSLSSFGLSAILGAGININNILMQASQILGSTGSNITKAITSDLQKTVLDNSKIQNTAQKATTAFARVRNKNAKIAPDQTKKINEIKIAAAGFIV